MFYWENTGGKSEWVLPHFTGQNSCWSRTRLTNPYYFCITSSALCIIFLGCFDNSRYFQLFPAVPASALCINFPGYFSSSWQFWLQPFASAFSAVPTFPENSGCSWQFRLLRYRKLFCSIGSLHLSVCILLKVLLLDFHCPSAAEWSLNSISLANPALGIEFLINSFSLCMFPNEPQVSILYFSYCSVFNGRD